MAGDRVIAERTNSFSQYLDADIFLLNFFLSGLLAGSSKVNGCGLGVSPKAFIAHLKIADPVNTLPRPVDSQK
jgi:hypothetical protein